MLRPPFEPGSRRPRLVKPVSVSVKINGADLPFVSTWVTTNTSTGSSTSTQVKLPLTVNGSYNFEVDWGDGNTDTITTWNQSEVTHTYSSSGTYEITITGEITGWSFNNTGDKEKITTVSSWGPLALAASDTGHFYGTINLDCSSTQGLIDISAATSFADAFRNSSFNQPGVDAWDVSNINTFSFAFYGSDFNQPISSWVFKSGTQFPAMFTLCDFNQDISLWDVSEVVNFGLMFYLGAFNTSVDAWDVGLATALNNMFQSSSYNQPLNSWRPVSCTDFGEMFKDSSFDQPIGDWTFKATGNILVDQMFRNCPFDQDITGWTTSRFSNCAGMFWDNTDFNQAIGSWDIGNVISIGSMLRGATSFDQDLSAWDIQSLTDGVSFMTSAGLSVSNYEALLIGWEANTHNNGVTIDFGSSQYNDPSTAATARAALVADSWVITDGGAV